ncbi:MAG: tetratricopeptide repeat protein, partial [Planctomycetota bacterium]
LEQVTTDRECEVSARTALAEVYLRVGRMDEAVECAQIAAHARPDAETYAALSRTFLATGDVAKAEAAAKEAIEADALSADAHVALGSVLAAREQPQEAMAEADRALELYPYSVEALELAGSVQEKIGKYRRCAGYWQRALALNPWDARLHLRLSKVLGPELGEWTAYKEHSTRYAELEELRARAAR